MSCHLLFKFCCHIYFYFVINILQKLQCIACCATMRVRGNSCCFLVTARSAGLVPVISRRGCWSLLSPLSPSPAATPQHKQEKRVGMRVPGSSDSLMRIHRNHGLVTKAEPACGSPTATRTFCLNHSREIPAPHTALLNIKLFAIWKRQ